MTFEQLLAILADVRFQTWHFGAGVMGEGYYVQVRFTAPDRGTAQLHQAWSGRKWYVSKHATRPEVVQTCLKAVLTALEHEAREQFTYRGVALFQPHVDLDALVAIAEHKVQRALSPASMVDVSGNGMENS